MHAQFALAVNLAKAKLKGGTGSATAVLAARSAAVQLDNRITVVDADIASARATLQRWIGNAAGRTLADAPDFSTLPVPPAQLQHNLNRQGPLLGWDTREAQAQAKLALAKAGDCTRKKYRALSLGELSRRAPAGVQLVASCVRRRHRA